MCSVLGKCQSNPQETTNPVLLYNVVTTIMIHDDIPHATIDRFSRQLFSIAPKSTKLALMCEVRDELA